MDKSDNYWTSEPFERLRRARKTYEQNAKTAAILMERASKILAENGIEVMESREISDGNVGLLIKNPKAERPLSAATATRTERK